MNHAYTNKLISETSPYLIQHAHNPVNWYPWGEEALQKAITENKPILVSIGYAACHWCHVMERESFEDPETARFMNEHFVNIKIDREERPDLDHIYMDAVQAITGSGGWPLNVFLTPDKKPFYGGTYFPPVRAYNRASWIEILMGVQKNYQEKKQDILNQAENLTRHLESSNAFGIQIPERETAKGFFTETSMQLIANQLLENADTVFGGFGNAPKFPQTFSIQFLLRHYHFTGFEPALKQALLSLDKMIEGGIYDQLGGGFARYSTDKEWLAPHFEKMLYDNALLVMVMAEAFQITQNPVYRKAIEETLAFIEREMLSEENGFYSALDADSEGVEGKFYTWSKAEIDALLQSEAALFTAFYDISVNGNWEEVNILRIRQPLEPFAQAQGLPLDQLKATIEKNKKILLQQRSQRVRPLLDDKILLGWNALMNTAYSKAYAALANPDYKEMAIKNMAFLEKRLSGTDGNWLHTYKNQEARIPAFLDDYAYLIQAYIHLQEITGQGAYLLKAEKLCAHVTGSFSEDATGFFFYTKAGQADVIIRKKEVYDGAVPSGNAVMAHNLRYLAKVFDKPEWQEKSSSLILSLSNAITKYPGSFAVWATAAQLITKGTLEIAITGQQAKDFLCPVLARFIPNKILQTEETNSSLFPLLAGKTGDEKGQLSFYLCENYACKAPFYTLEDFLANV
ncbi:MAG: hypothetical protein RLZZ28_2614 [Bacteroidota bacterium]